MSPALEDQPQPFRVYKSPAGERAFLAFRKKVQDLVPFPVESRTVRVEGTGDVHVSVAGPEGGRPLVLWPGYGCPAPLMILWTQELVTQEGYRVYCPDLPGHGGSLTFPVPIKLTGEAFGQFALHVLRALGLLEPGLPKPLHLGSSLGGALVMGLMTVAPETMGGAAMTIPTGLHPGYGTSLSWTLRLMFGLVFWFVLNGLLPCPLTERWMLRTVMDDDGPHGTGREVVLLTNAHTNPCPGPPPRYTDAQLSRNTAPVLVIAAEDDVLVGDGKTLAARAAKVIPHCTAETVPGKHMSDAKTHERIAERIMRFLSAVPVTKLPE